MSRSSLRRREPVTECAKGTRKWQARGNGVRLDSKNNMIKFINCYETGGKLFAALQQAQAFELALLIQPEISNSENPPSEKTMAVAGLLIEKRDAVVDILHTNAKSRPKARKIHGGRKPRKEAKPDEAKPDES